MPHTYANLLTHVIFSTKARYPFLDSELKPRVLPHLGGIAEELKVRPLAINGPADHAHLLLAVPASLAVADLMRILKTNSSRWVHEQWASRSTFAWQEGHGAFSVSESMKEDVRAYIAGQEEHHCKISFQDEFIAFLKRHGIEYDERYIWD